MIKNNVACLAQLFWHEIMAQRNPPGITGRICVHLMTIYGDISLQRTVSSSNVDYVLVMLGIGEYVRGLLYMIG